MRKLSALVSPPPPMASPTIFILLVFFLVADFPLSSVSSSDPRFPYSDHCASFVPESSPKELVSPDSSLTQLHQGYSRDPNQASLYFDPFDFRLRSVRRTDAEGLFMVDGYFRRRNQSYEEIFSDGLHSNWSRHDIARTRLRLRGFWVESTGKLCMVGVGSVKSMKGDELRPISVLKLNNLKSSTTINSLITGTFDSLSSERSTLSILILPEINYHFTLVPDENGNGEFLQSLSPVSPPERRICTFGRYDKFDLKYSKKVLSAKNSSLFEGPMEYLPKIFFFNRLECSEEGQRIRFLAVFSTRLIDRHRHNNYFNPNLSLIGEAFWDESQNQTLFFACRFSGMVRSFDGANVGDCSIRMSFQYPTIESIRDTAFVVGKIWSTKSDKEPGYFDTITFQQPLYNTWGLLDLKYEYTQIDKWKKFCTAKNGTKGYVDAYDLRFDASSMNSNLTSYGYFQPRFVGNRKFDPFSVQSRVSGGGKANISYHIQFYGSRASVIWNGLQLNNILAEGVIDFETGSLCMIGCRDIGPENQILESSSMDCEILVKVEFPLLGKNQTYTQGSIESLRSNSDPLFFETWEFESAAFGMAVAEESVWRLDSEIVVVLISTTFACLFLVRQLFYVNKRPQFLPFMSISMLILLFLGYLMPLVLTFEVLFVTKSEQDKILFEAGGWLMADQVAIRVVQMVAFLLQFYLLIISWSARSTEESRSKIWAAEKKALIVTISLLVMVGSIVVLIDAFSDNYEFYGNFWRNLKSFGGLAVDAFLLPQILVNGFGNLEGKFLSSSFYVGNTAVRLLPRAYNVYRGDERRASRYFNASFIYENRNDLFYSTGWDVIVFHLSIMLAIVIFVQQKLGGRFML